MADMGHENQSDSCSKCKMPLSDPTDYFERYGYRHAIVLILVITVFLILLAIKAYMDNRERNKRDTNNLEKIESDKEKSINQQNSKEEIVNVEALLRYQYFQYVNSILMEKSQYKSKEIKFDGQYLNLKSSNDQMDIDSNSQQNQTQLPAATYINFNQHSHHLRNTL